MLQTLQDSGQTVPALQRRPVLEPDLAFSFSLFWEISSTERPAAFEGKSPIPLSAFVEYANFLAIPVIERQRFWRHIRVLDTEFLKFVRQKQEEERARSKTKPKAAPPRRR